MYSKGSIKFDWIKIISDKDWAMQQNNGTNQTEDGEEKDPNEPVVILTEKELRDLDKVNKQITEVTKIEQELFTELEKVKNLLQELQKKHALILQRKKRKITSTWYKEMHSSASIGCISELQFKKPFAKIYFWPVLKIQSECFSMAKRCWKPKALANCNCWCIPINVNKYCTCPSCFFFHSFFVTASEEATVLDSR